VDKPPQRRIDFWFARVNLLYHSSLRSPEYYAQFCVEVEPLPRKRKGKPGLDPREGKSKPLVSSPTRVTVAVQPAIEKGASSHRA
jgi:hypothetical protein